ncbi:VanZ family protein [Microbacterium aurum]
MQRADRRRRVARVGLVAYGVLLGLSVLPAITPMSFVRLAATWLREAGASYVRDGWVEVAMNVVMFTPFAMLLILSSRWRPFVGLAIACATSVTIELVQLALPGRVASARDVAANVLGAVIGYAIARLILWLERRT